MEGIDGVLVEWRSEDGKVIVPLCSAEDEDMMRIDLANSRRYAFV